MLFDDFSIPSKVIYSGDRKVMEVRGLSFADISELVNNHKPDVDKILELWNKFDKDDMPEASMYEAMAQFAIELLNTAPAIITNVVAMCADCVDQIDRIARLPLSIQISAIEGIIYLTSEDFGGMKPMLGKIISLIGQNAPKAISEQLNKATQAQNG